MIATRTGKIAAALFALLFAYFLKSTILDYATEPKVLGGIDLDHPIPQAMPWTPIYYPLLLSAAFAYWIWPTKAYGSLGPKIANGILAMFGASYFAMFISFFCAIFGEFYLSLPHLTKMEILFGPVGVLFGALGGTAIFGLFFMLWFIVFSIFSGCLIALVVHALSKCFALPSSGLSEERARLDFASLSTFLRSSNAWPWPSLLAGLVAVAIAVAGFVSGSPAIIVMWAAYLLPWGLLWIAVGAAIGFASRHWAWCVAISLPIGYLSSTRHEKLQGILASQSIDFPPILLATLLGFALARKLLRRLAPQTAAG